MAVFTRSYGITSPVVLSGWSDGENGLNHSAAPESGFDFAERLGVGELPIVAVLDELGLQLESRDEVVLEAPPGAGKTTLVPLAMLSQPCLGGGKILVLEPRRLAARAAAQRMANLLGEAPGATVGYRMRLDTRVGPNTRIEVITEGILTRMLQNDPALEGVALVIFDEFHERSLDSDLALALCIQGRQLYRDGSDPLKLLVMSATLDGTAIAKMLDNAPVLRSQGRMYPVAVHYQASTPALKSVVASTVQLLLRLLQELPNESMLVFLPGQGEIHRVARSLREKLQGMPSQGEVDVVSLYGSLDIARQRLAIEAPASGRCKIVLATNIAETSLTIEGVTVVVDAGLVREAAFDAATAMTRLQTRRISKASSVQRMGRAGRLAPGQCYRLWSEAQQHQLAEHASPEISRADLAPLALQLLAWGVEDPAELDWLDPPPLGPFQAALQLLANLSAADQSSAGNWRLTAHGEELAQLPMHPRLAHMLCISRSYGLAAVASRLAAVLSEQDPLRSAGADLWQRWQLLQEDARPTAAQRPWRQRVLKHSERYLQSLKGSVAATQAMDIHTALGFLLANAYPDRIAKRRGGTTYQLANGRSACLDPDDTLLSCEWLAVAELGGRAGSAEDRIYTAAALEPTLLDQALAAQLHEQDSVAWDDSRLVAQRSVQLGAISVKTKPLASVSVAQREAAFLAMLKRRGLDVLPWTEQLRQWQARVLLMHNLETGKADNPWPDVSDAHLLDRAESWLLPWLDKRDSLAQLQKLDLASLLHALLPWAQQQALDAQAPQRIQVPSGSQIKIDYSQNPPVLAVKLQEMFSCAGTPRIANGRVTLLLHLLSPARRPLQVTQDLEGFWRGSYNEVKKEMKGRYPKHPWPDDPISAAPSRHTKRRGN